MRKKLLGLTGAVAFVAAMAATPVMAEDTTISGAGASFPALLYGKWAEKYYGLTGVKLNYQSIGSGAGITQIKAKTVDFGASDAPLTKEELDKSGLMQFPMIVGGVVPVLSVPGIQPGQLKLTGKVLADIYLGKVEKWNDPAIAGLNPDLALPDQAIVVVHRSDGSGTSWIYTNYISKMSPEWKAKVGSATSVKWPAGVGAKGNEGVAANVKELPGAIGYVEFAYALQNKMCHAQLQNQAGQFVQPTFEAFSAAAAGADWKSARDVHGPDRPGGRDELADYRRVVHPDLQGTDRRRQGRSGAEVLRLVLQERDRAGQRAVLRADTRGGLRSRRGAVERGPVLRGTEGVAVS